MYHLSNWKYFGIGQIYPALEHLCSKQKDILDSIWREWKWGPEQGLKIEHFRAGRSQSPAAGVRHNIKAGANRRGLQKMSLGSIFPEKYLPTKMFTPPQLKLGELSKKLGDIGLSLKQGREKGEKSEEISFDPRKPWLLSNILPDGKPSSTSATYSPAFGRWKQCSHTSQGETSEEDTQFQVAPKSKPSCWNPRQSSSRLGFRCCCLSCITIFSIRSASSTP